MRDNERLSLLEKIKKAREAWREKQRRQHEEQELLREELETEVERAITKTKIQNKEYYAKAMVSINQARNASTAAQKEIYIDKLRFNLSLYLYMQSLQDAFIAMKEKLDIQHVNENFVDILNRFSEIQKSAPKTNEDIRKTTKKAMQGMKNDNLGDLNEVVSGFVKNTLNYSGSYTFDDVLINDLIEGKKKLEDLPGVVETTAGPVIPDGSVKTQTVATDGLIPQDLMDQAKDLETMLDQL